MHSQRSFVAGSEFPTLEKGKLRLYSMRLCPFAQRARLVLEHKNIEHETINIDLGNKPDWFLEKNPLGLVPVLEIDDKIICESDVCCDYLNETYGAQLYPSHPEKREQDKCLIQNYSKITTPYYDTLFSLGKKDGAIQAFHEGRGLFEFELKNRGGVYFGGDRVMMVDFIVYPHMERAVLFHKAVPNMEFKKDNYPLLFDWIHCMPELPAVKRTMISDEHHVEFLENYAVGRKQL